MIRSKDEVKYCTTIQKGKERWEEGEGMDENPKRDKGEMRN